MKNISLFALLAVLLTACGGYEETEGGIKFTNHTNGGGERPVPGDLVYFHAQMRNGDSVVFGSRQYGQTPSINISAPANGKYASPVEEILTYIGVGDSITMLVDLDTIDPKPKGFENTNVMYYDIVLLDVVSTAKINSVKAQEGPIASMLQETVAKYNNGDLDEELKSTDSGLKYIIHQEGNGQSAVPGKEVKVHYYGVTTDGSPFDNSFSRGQPFGFVLGAGMVIPGWDEGISLLKEGAKATLFIPSELGYGEQGAPPVIPPNSELIFYVELQKVQ